MEAKKKIELALAYAGKRKADLARGLGISPQTLNKRLQTGKFSFLELEKIGEVIGAKFFTTFRFDDGTEV